MLLNNKRFCKFHYKYYYNYYITTIQKYYRAYRQRRLVKNIYKKLPNDLQRHIIYFIRQDYYYQKYKNILRKIVEPIINTFIIKTASIWYDNNVLDHEFNNYISDNINYFMYVYNLYEKYNKILTNVVHYNMTNHFKNILKIYYLYDDSTILDPDVIKNIRIAYYKLAIILEQIEYSEC